MTKRASKRDAEAVLRAVRKQFRAYLDPKHPVNNPVLIRDWSWAGGTNWAICWESGPYDWAVTFNPEGGEVDEEMTTLAMTMREYVEYERTGRITNPVRTTPAPIPPTVWTEPYSSWALMVHPKNEGGDA